MEMETPTYPAVTPHLAGDPGLVLPPDEIPCLDHIVTEDDTPVDNIYSTHQRTLLTEPLFSSWAGPGKGRQFLAVSDVGLFYAVSQPPLVPDAMLSLDVEVGEDLNLKQNRSYFIWILGKPPEVVFEVVSNREGGEDTYKIEKYAQLGILHYVIWDPFGHLSDQRLRVYGLTPKGYQELGGKNFFPRLGLGVTLWEGTYEARRETWLRWCDADGVVIPTGAERADAAEARADTAESRAEAERKNAKAERKQAEAERKKAEAESHRADTAESRAERLAAQLRKLGAEPENGVNT